MALVVGVPETVHVFVSSILIVLFVRPHFADVGDHTNGYSDALPTLKAWMVEADVLPIRVPADRAVHLRGLKGKFVLVLIFHFQRNLAIRGVVLPEDANVLLLGAVAALVVRIIDLSRDFFLLELKGKKRAVYLLYFKGEKRVFTFGNERGVERLPNSIPLDLHLYLLPCRIRWRLVRGFNGGHDVLG